MKNVYSIYDNSAQAFGQPFFMNTDMQAQRAFFSTISNPESDFARFPMDFILHKIGTYYEATGEITGIEPTRIISAQELINQQQLAKELEDAKELATN
jgi:hypothetical protein